MGTIKGKDTIAWDNDGLFCLACGDPEKDRPMTEDDFAAIFEYDDKAFCGACGATILEKL